MERDAGLTVAVIALVFAGVDTARTIWGWWHHWRRRADADVEVMILLADGARVEVSGVGRDELDGIVRRAVSQR